MCVCFTMCMCVMQEELRPEYEEALLEKKAKVKELSKKKVLFLGLCFRFNFMICDTN